MRWQEDDPKRVGHRAPPSEFVLHSSESGQCHRDEEKLHFQAVGLSQGSRKEEEVHSQGVTNEGFDARAKITIEKNEHTPELTTDRKSVLLR